MSKKGLENLGARPRGAAQDSQQEAVSEFVGATSRVTFVIPKELQIKFKNRCTSRGKSMSDVLVDFVKRWVREGSE